MANPSLKRTGVSIKPAANGPMASAAGSKVAVKPMRQGTGVGSKITTPSLPRKSKGIDQMMSSTRPGRQLNGGGASKSAMKGAD